MADMLLRAFRFRIKLRRSPNAEEGAQPSEGLPTGTALGDGAFQDCTGLEIELDVQNYQEGGRNDGVIQRVGRGKYQNIVLKRGMFYGDSRQVNTDLWQWMQDVVRGIRPVARYGRVIEVMSVGEKAAATWVFDRGLPARIRGRELHAKTGEVAIEEMHIAHEGLRLVI